MLDCVLDNMLSFPVVFQKNFDIPWATSCAPLLAIYFPHAYEADFLQWPPEIKYRT